MASGADPSESCRRLFSSEIGMGPTPVSAMEQGVRLWADARSTRQLVIHSRNQAMGLPAGWILLGRAGQPARPILREPSTMAVAAPHPARPLVSGVRIEGHRRARRLSPDGR